MGAKEDCRECQVVSRPEITFLKDRIYGACAVLNPNPPTYFLRFAILTLYHDPLYRALHMENEHGLLFPKGAIRLADRSYSAIKSICEDYDYPQPTALRLFHKEDIFNGHTNLDFIPQYERPIVFKSTTFPNSFGQDPQGNDILVGSRKGLPPLDSAVYVDLIEMMRQKVS